MRWALIAVLVLTGAIAAGCGGGTKTVIQTTPAQPATTTPAPAPAPAANPSPASMQGPAGTMGPPPNGNPYDATTPKVLRHIEAAVTTALQQKGIANPVVKCTGVSPAEASCNVSNPANGKAIVATVAVDQQTGALNITKVTPA